jgi:hypothetical protein
MALRLREIYFFPPVPGIGAGRIDKFQFRRGNHGKPGILDKGLKTFPVEPDKTPDILFRPFQFIIINSTQDKRRQQNVDAKKGVTSLKAASEPAPKPD